ncbi:phage tail tape measure protein [Fibrobacter sp. UWP2]|uniref:phage tail tape measure protein n=1 Tax=Fibrobacter sp. UWP2 TaxID=1896216 RepID=UPI00091D2F31|nr:phage tail tape measure protein [Fibrobacter sp. UWP2]SHJ39726.1 phage tail tape measure protein, TP901 family, core region [Fibrobacter sp. UWP2]
MANKTGIETVISVTDGFSKEFLLFEKRVNHALQPIKKLEYSFKRFDRVSGFKALRKSLTDLKDHSSSIFHSITSIGTGVGIIAGATGLLVSKINKVALMGDDLAKTSKRLGMSVESLQKFEYVAELAGVPVENMQKNMQRLSLTALRAAGGVKKESEAFKALHIKVKNIDGTVKSSEQLLVDLSSKFVGTSLTATEKLYAAVEIFGKEGGRMVNLLEQGPDAIKAQMKQVEKYGIMTKEQAEASERYNDSLTAMHWAFRGMAVEIGTHVIPVLTEAVEKITEVFSKNKEKYVKSFMKIVEKLPELVDVFLDRLPGLLRGIAGFLSVIEKIVDWFGIVKTLGALVIGSVFVPLASAFVALTKIGAVLVRGLFVVVMHIGKILVGAAKKALMFLPKLKLSFLGIGGAAKGVIPVLKRFGTALKASFGPLGWGLLIVEELWPLVKKIADRWDEMSFTSFDGIVKSFGILRDITVEWLDSLGPVGDIIKGIGKFGNKIFGGKVDFSGIPEDPIAKAMDEIPPPESVEKSELFQSITSTKTINKNTNQIMEIRIKDPHKVAEVRKIGFSDPSMYGNSMMPAF